MPAYGAKLKQLIAQEPDLTLAEMNEEPPGVDHNLGAHKNDRTLALIAQAGAEVRFLPAYSPDLNPIEMMWSKVKSLLRKAQARTLHDLLQAIAAALRAVTTQDALGWFAACGYSYI
jgi:hypothetical protein